MHDLILHHYPQSPVSEKIRLAMGLKSMAWRSVEQNRLPERPELLAMTGGYRRLPVLQIGADLYCDTQCILRTLEQIAPQPTLFPDGGEGLAFALSRWTDGPMFDLAMRVSFAPLTGTLPSLLVADRTRLYLGPDGDFTRELADLPHTLAQLRPQLGWLDAILAGGAFICGPTAGMADILAWFIVWFLRGRSQRGDRLLDEFPHLCEWEERIRLIGHGRPAPLSPDEALDVARSAEPLPASPSDPDDPQGLRPGMPVAIRPLGDTGEQPVTGIVASANQDTVAIGRNDPRCGRVVVHLPRVGYRVTIL